MSNFRKFSLPRLLIREESHNDGIPRFDCYSLAIKDRIGQRAFVDVYTTDYRAPGKDSTETVVIKKMLSAMDKEEKLLFSKEVAVLNSLTHRSIVKFMGVCYRPPAMMLEYVYFDFNIFGPDIRVSALSDFLLNINEQNCSGFHEIVNHAATEIIDGLTFLHSKDIAHRDLKAANVLVSNQQYSSLPVDSLEFQQKFDFRPIACKLTDFGESRSRFIQTRAVVSSKTTTTDRGIVVYMAPELLVTDKLTNGASLSDLMMSDVWALGMIIFTMINPSLKSPYIVDIRSESVSTPEEVKKFIISLLRKEKLPSQDGKYDIDRATVWCTLEKVYRGCTNFERQQRLSLQDAALILARRESRLTRDLGVVHLKISQATALEKFDRKVASDVEVKHVSPLGGEMMPINDGTNACAFLSIVLAEHVLLASRTDDFFGNLPESVESAIWHLPGEINEHRDLGKTYDALEAYKILREKQNITPLEFSEDYPLQMGFLRTRVGKNYSRNFAPSVLTVSSLFTQVILSC